MSVQASDGEATFRDMLVFKGKCAAIPHEPNEPVLAFNETEYGDGKLPFGDSLIWCARAGGYSVVVLWENLISRQDIKHGGFDNNVDLEASRPNTAIHDPPPPPTVTIR